MAVPAKLLFFVLAFLSSTSRLFAEIYTVVSNGSPSSCPGDRTQCSLMYYATHPDQYFREDNTIFFFLPGHHRLVNSTVVLMANVSNLTLYGTNMSEVSVVCDGEDSGGFQFYNIINLTIRELSMLMCSAKTLLPSPEFFQLPAVYMRETINVRMERVSIQNTTGQGLTLNNVYGNNTIDDITIKYSHKSNITGGVNFFYYCQEYGHVEFANSIVISKSIFEHGESHQSNCSGIIIEVLCSYDISLTFNNVTIAGNSGGNIWMNLGCWSSLWAISISFIDCTISNGTANSGGGLGLYATTGFRCSQIQLENSTKSLLYIENTIFKRNTAYHVGGAIYLRLRENTHKHVGSIMLKNCTFQKNKIYHTTNHGGVAVHVVTYILPRYIQRSMIYYKISFSDCLFIENAVQASNKHYGASPPRTGVIYTENAQSVTLEDCHITNNNCSGIVGISSNFLMHGKNEIRGNRAVKGGGIFLCSSSMMHLYNSTVLNISENYAYLRGGGIYVDGECSPAVELCFFQVDNATADNATLSLTQVHLINNTAHSGSALFGGNVDTCILFDKHGEKYHHYIPSYIFNITFHIQHKNNDLSVISSDPEFVRFCKLNATTAVLNYSNCPLNITQDVKPGQRFHIYSIIVGQRHGLVSGVVVADCINCSILPQEFSQYVNFTHMTSTLLNYTIFSKEKRNVTLKLVAEDYYSGFPTYQYTPSHITVRVEKCPLGFIERKRSCSCLLAHTPCDLTKQMVYRSNPIWIGYYNESSISNRNAIILHSYCPQGHCIDTNVNIHSTTHHFYQDVQCAPNRTGLLCGRCKQNYSLGFGSSQCLSGCGTPHKYLQYLRVIGLTAVCGVAGILLVVLLTLLNLTVAEGTLNGLIFYANIVQVNVDIFFPSDTRSRPWTAFIAWLNLDFGVTVCFYDGMDAYIKTWLQFIFPLYLWMLSGAIVYFSWKSRRIAKLAGRNAVQVLATLFLLSFGKLIRTAIAAWFFTNVKSYDGSINILAWLLDANVHYLHGKHTVLFFFASFAGIAALLYALILTFIQCLRRSPNSRMCRWVQRLKPLLDAYTGPYKDKYHFWTGFLLLVRISLFITFACNFNNNPSVNLTLTITAASLLMLGILKGIYRNRAIKLLEGSLYTNLVLFSVFTMLVMKKSSGEKLIVVCVFSMWSLLTLVGVMVYHAYKYCCGRWIRHHLRLFFESRLRLSNARSATAVQPLIIAQEDADDSSECCSDEEREREMNDQVWATPNLR